MDESMKLASREKYWKELTSEEKVERMRKIVKHQAGEISFLRQQLDSLQEHVHVGNNIYNRRGRYGYEEIGLDQSRRSEKDDEVFF